LPSLRVGENAAQVDNSVADDDAEPEWGPRLLFHRMKDAIADMVVIDRWIRHVTGKTCKNLKQIGPRDDPDNFLITHHGQSLDVFHLHQVDDVGQRHVLRHSEGFRGHDVGYFAAMLADKVVRKRA
jgi:hypothetical protein